MELASVPQQLVERGDCMVSPSLVDDSPIPFPIASPFFTPVFIIHSSEWHRPWIRFLQGATVTKTLTVESDTAWHHSTMKSCLFQNCERRVCCWYLLVRNRSGIRFELDLFSLLEKGLQVSQVLTRRLTALDWLSTRKLLIPYSVHHLTGELRTSSQPANQCYQYSLCAFHLSHCRRCRRHHGNPSARHYWRRH